MGLYPCGLGSETITMEQLMALLQSHGVPRDVGITMAAIATSESVGRHVRAVGDCNLVAHPGSQSYGLFQILTAPKDQAAEGPKLLTADYNTAVAVSIHNSRGFTPWTVYKTGSYRTHIGDATTAANAIYGNPKNSDSVLSTIKDDVIAGGKAVVSPVTDTASGIAAIAQDIGRGAAWFGDRHNWIRIIEVIAGIIAVGLGLIILGRNELGPLAKTAAIAAV